MSEAFERVRSALDTHGSRIRDNRADHFMAQCPAHEDNNPSLGVDDKGDRVMVHCYAGCFTDDVVASLGLELKDLFDGDLSDATQEWDRKGQWVRSYLYERANGEPWFYVDRYFPKTFRQRLPDVAHPVKSLDDLDGVKQLGLRGRPPIIYHFPRVLRAVRKEPTTVWWLDGEKDVETAERHGLVATCAPGFAKWDAKYADALKEAAEIVMVVDQDKEKPDGSLGAGQQAAITARLGFRSVGLKVRTVAPAVGKDLTDHFAGGYTVDDFVVEPTIYTRPRGMSAATLSTHTFDPQVFAVEGILPSGLTIAAGPPKGGKSWLFLDMCLAVAMGGNALSELRTTQGSALYLAREDNYRRLQSRIGLLLGGEMDRAPKGLELIPSEHPWPGGEEGIANLTEWAEEVGDPRLVVIDTLQKVEPDMGEDRRGNAYTGNYSMMARYKGWADQHNLSLVMIHHDTKASATARGDNKVDPFTRISGTRGLTGAADTLWFLEADRESRTGELHVTGRDVVEQSLELLKVGPLWRSLDRPES